MLGRVATTNKQKNRTRKRSKTNEKKTRQITFSSSQKEKRNVRKKKKTVPTTELQALEIVQHYLFTCRKSSNQL